MKEIGLFKSSRGINISNAYLDRALRAVKANEADILFMHTEMSFGAPNPALSRKQLMDEVFCVLEGLGARTLCVPTFTFSFCNGVDYDVKNSKSKMGLFNEYFRKRCDTLRSVDPLMSISLFGKDTDLATQIGKSSIGKGSSFDLLHKKSGVKFLFLGASPGACMTYTHYVEAVLNVPYRYNREFTGMITDSDGRRYKDTYSLFVRYNGVKPATDNRLQKYLLANGTLLEEPCGDASIFCIAEPDAYKHTQEQIEKDANYMLARPFEEGNRDTTFMAKDMVAL